jgi:hypothetical protein
MTVPDSTAAGRDSDQDARNLSFSERVGDGRLSLQSRLGEMIPEDYIAPQVGRAASTQTCSRVVQFVAR